MCVCEIELVVLCFSMLMRKLLRVSRSPDTAKYRIDVLHQKMKKNCVVERMADRKSVV